MSHPHGRRKHYLEHSPESGEDDGSRRMQTFSAHQDASTHQYHHDYQDPGQQPYQQSHQNPIQHQNQPIHPGQFQGQHLAQYATHQRPQQSLENPVHQSFEDLEEDPDDYSEEDTDEDVEDDIEEDMGEGSDEGSDDYQVDEPIGQPSEDPDLGHHRASDSQQAHGAYQTVGTSAVTRDFSTLGLTSLDAQPGPSQPRATSQATGTRARNLRIPALPNPMPNPYGSYEQPVTGYEQSAPETESILDPVTEQYVRSSLACDTHIDDIANLAELDVHIVRRFVLSKSLAWTPEQDDQLLAMMDQGLTMSVILGHLNSRPGGPIRFDDEVNSRVLYLRSGGRAARQELAGIPQNDPQQHLYQNDPAQDPHQNDPGQYLPQNDPRRYSMIPQPGEALPPQANQELAEEATPLLDDHTPWERHEVRKLVEWQARHSRKWVGVEMEIPGRTRRAITEKWRRMCKDGKDQHQGSRESEDVVQQRGQGQSLLPGREGQDYGGRQVASQPFRGRELGNQDQGGSAAGQGERVRRRRPKKLTEVDLGDIRCERANGLSLEQINSQERFSVYAKATLQQALHRDGWTPWTAEEDGEVLGLQPQEGNNEWAQISSTLVGKRRIKREVEARYKCLKGDQMTKQQRRKYGFEDDEKLRRKLAKGRTYAHVARRGLRDFSQMSIRQRALRIRANWTDSDDEQLRDMDLEPGPDATFDWDSVGQQLDPKRKGDMVKRRWRYLQGEEISTSEDEESEDEI